MADWIDDFADALAVRLNTPGGELSVGMVESQGILDIARDVSHATERVNAPLVSYLIGRYVAVRVAGGADAEHALAEARDIVRQTLPAADPG